MIFHTAHLTCRADVVEAFKARLLRHARTSVEREPGGCLRFDVHQETTDPRLFLLLEEYADDGALDAHRASVHYKAFREDTKDWVIDRKWWFWSPAKDETPTRNFRGGDPQ
ncbi:MAG TPA: putative quinol monooxygenase [Burkholderiales bacterium]|nr:putative quinol monooxygenase [Burkholderiales bacterium]